jgi:hypothetical protein
MRFNKKTKTPNTTINRAGGEAFVLDAELKLVSLLLTSFVQDQFYRSAGEQLDELAQLIDVIPDKRFVAQAAVYARRVHGIRSISHVAAAEIAARVKGEGWTKHFYSAVIQRPDDVTEILAYYMSRYGRTIPNALKKGLGAALAAFGPYQLGKYRAERSAVSLVDAVNLCHPPHTAALAALIKGTLETPDTWETRLTQAGQTAGDDEDLATRKQEAWGELIATRKLGYFALLRNLRNIAEQAPESLDAALEMLVDERLIHKSLVLPFRYLTALEEINKQRVPRARDVVVAISRAVDVALANVPVLPGSTLVAVDVSGSMSRVINKAALFGATLYKANQADMILFDGDARYLTPNPLDAATSIAAMIIDKATGGSTNFHSVLDTANRPYDRVVFLSDMQGWVGHNAPTASLANYERRLGVRPIIYSFDLQGYGTLQFPQNRVYCLAGFSEKVFDVMALLETDRDALIATIKQITF